MAEQPQLDLPDPATQPVQKGRGAKQSRFAGFSRSQMVAGLLLLVAAIWGMWVTKLLVTPREDRIVSARLSSIVGEYVQAQARSASPPSQVEAEMRGFMASLDKELQRRSAGGQIVLVGEAVLTKNVPDITDSLRKAVYASGVPRPREASAADLERMSPQAMAAAQPQIMTQPPTAAMVPTIDPMAAAGGMPAPQADLQAAPRFAPPAASVSTFGGPDGAGGQ